MDGVATDSIIEGVQLIPLQRLPDQRGAVSHMLKATDPHFVRFGEIYFSSAYPGVVNAWKNHERVITNYACVFGDVKFVLYDERDGSASKGICTEVFLGNENYSLLVVPPGVWNGFQGMSEPVAIVAICATEPHDPTEFHRLEPADARIPYDWLK